MHILNSNLFNVCIICIWIDDTYILPSFYRTTLSRYCSIGPTLIYQRWANIGCFIFVCKILSNNDFIYNFIVVFNSFYFCGNGLYSFPTAFSDILIPYITYVLSVKSYHIKIIIGPDYNLLTYFLLIELQMQLLVKCPTMGHLCIHMFL